MKNKLGALIAIAILAFYSCTINRITIEKVVIEQKSDDNVYQIPESFPYHNQWNHPIIIEDSLKFYNKLFYYNCDTINFK